MFNRGGPDKGHTHNGDGDQHEGDHQQLDDHGHVHGAIDPSITSTQRGIWAVKWSFVGLMATATFQIVVALLSGSVALLGDTFHNFGDAATAIPLWIAFLFARRKANTRFTYGYGRVEDLAGVIIVLAILLSAVFAGYVSINRFFHPQQVDYIGIVMVASVVGFIGNEAVALFRMKIGKQIGSAALVADGYHARADGLTSLAVLFGAIGVWLGFPLADPIVGLIIAIFLLKMAWDSGKTVFTRLLDGVDPEVAEQIRHAAGHIPGVLEVTQVRVRWSGHRLHAEANLAVNPELTIEKGHDIAKEVQHEILHEVDNVFNATIHVDPMNASGEEYHRVDEHVHGGLPFHSH